MVCLVLCYKMRFILQNSKVVITEWKFVIKMFIHFSFFFPLLTKKNIRQRTWRLHHQLKFLWTMQACPCSLAASMPSLESSDQSLQVLEKKNIPREYLHSHYVTQTKIIFINLKGGFLLPVPSDSVPERISSTVITLSSNPFSLTL